MSSYNHNNSSNPNQNPFEDSSESGLSSSRFDYNAQYQQQQPQQQQQAHQQRDLIDLQQNQHQAFSNSTSSSTLQQQPELTTPAYIHQGSHQQIKRGDSSFALDEGIYHLKTGRLG